MKQQRWHTRASSATIQRMLYFDHNATAPLLREAGEAWLRANHEFPANASSQHRLGGRADAALTRAREGLAEFLGCDPATILWTSGATEANNMALHHLAATCAQGTGFLSDLEHPSIMESARHYFGNRLEVLGVNGQGVVWWQEATERLKREKPAFTALMAANNETGVLQPWQEAQAFCQERNIPFLCDATQWIGKMPARGLGACDFVAGSAHKFGGPKGVGFLKCPTGTVPLLRGGKQEEGRRAGTENVPGVLAMIAALRKREENPGAALEVRQTWRQAFENGIRQQIPGARVLGETTARLWNTSTVVFPEVDCRQRWVVKLDREGIAASTGSACASGEEKPSRTLLAMGLTEAECSRTVRFSSGWETLEEDWQTALAAVLKVHRKMREN